MIVRALIARNKIGCVPLNAIISIKKTKTKKTNKKNFQKSNGFSCLNKWGNKN